MKKSLLVMVIMMMICQMHGAFGPAGMSSGARGHVRAKSCDANNLANLNSQGSSTSNPNCDKTVTGLKNAALAQASGLNRGNDSGPAGKSKAARGHSEDCSCNRCAQGCCLAAVTLGPLLIQLGLL